MRYTMEARNSSSRLLVRRSLIASRHGRGSQVVRSILACSVGAIDAGVASITRVFVVVLQQRLRGVVDAHGEQSHHGQYRHPPPRVVKFNSVLQGHERFVFIVTLLVASALQVRSLVLPYSSIPVSCADRRMIA